MPEKTKVMICTECYHKIIPTEHNWSLDESRPLCYECWTKLDELHDIFERERLDEEVERMR